MFVLISFSVCHLHFDTLEQIYKVVLVICRRLAGTDKEKALLCSAEQILPQTGDRSVAIITSRGSYRELMLLNLGLNFFFIYLFYFLRYWPTLVITSFVLVSALMQLGPGGL